jgi:hypothetical protein
LNEKNEVEAILKGERVHKSYTYRTCYLLAKYYKELGHSLLETRIAIFEWANKYKIYITDDLNSIIQRAYNDKVAFNGEVEIKISKEDLDEIFGRFTKKNTRLTAFAILCYAKVNADKNGEFRISRVGLANWIGLWETDLSKLYIKELINFGYLEKIDENEGIKFIKRKKKHVSKMLLYKINVNFKNKGEYVFKDDNFREEFAKIIEEYKA